MNLKPEVLVNLSEEDLEEQFAWIDHRSAEDEVVDAVAEQISQELVHYWKDETGELWVKLEGREHCLPLSMTRHDRYVAISSLAELLKDKYQFLLLKETLEDDTHGLLVLNNSDARELQDHFSGWFNEKLIPLELGKDYFNGIKVNYLGNLNNNLDFEKEAQEIQNALVEFKSEFRKIFNTEIKKPKKKFNHKLVRLIIIILTILYLFYIKNR